VEPTGDLGLADTAASRGLQHFFPQLALRCSGAQSGDVSCPHYRDLYELLVRGKYFQIFYSRTKV
jgi:hypothetical protein